MFQSYDIRFVTIKHMQYIKCFNQKRLFMLKKTYAVSSGE